MDCSPPSSSVHGVFQARILGWVAIPFLRGSSQSSDWTRVSCVSCIGRWILYHCTTREALGKSKRLKSEPTRGVILISQWGVEVHSRQSWNAHSSQTLAGYLMHACMREKSLPHVQLCDPMDCSLPGSSVHGILQAYILEWVTVPYSRRSSRPRNRTFVSYTSCIGRRVLYHGHHLGSPRLLHTSIHLPLPLPVSGIPCLSKLHFTLQDPGQETLFLWSPTKCQLLKNQIPRL